MLIPARQSSARLSARFLSLATLYNLRFPFNQGFYCRASARVGTMRFESQTKVSIPPLPGPATLIFRESAYPGEDLTTNEWSPATKSASSSHSPLMPCRSGIAKWRTSISPPCPHASISILRELACFSPSIDITSAFNNCACIRWFLIARSQCNMAIELPSRAMLQRANNLSGDG
jgi:hypothetical protein